MSSRKSSRPRRHRPPRHRPPWKHDWDHEWEHDRAFARWFRRRRHKRGVLFARFVALFGLMVVLALGGMAALAYFLSRLFGTGGEVALLTWLGGCGLSLALPLLAAGLAFWIFQGITTPMADVMAASDAVAEGDLGVRVPVPEHAPRAFGRLAQSFNRMAEELERADRRRRNLTADVAHELRTPLHIIQGNLEGILDDVYEPGPEHIEATLDETRLLARLVEDLRTLSLAEAGQLPLVRERVDVRELLTDVHTSFSGQAEAAGIDLQLEVGEVPESLAILGDVGRLNQVLSNLMANALRHTSAGGMVTLAAEPIPDGVRFQVCDTGEGIPAEDLPYVFDRFWRGDRSRSRVGGAGSGLGLAIVRQLVQAHGGRVQVESAVGRGTTFTIDLPRGE